MIYQINENNPQKRIIQKATEVLSSGGIIIFPTDTVYSYGCDVSNKKSVDKLYHIKNISKSKPLSFIFSDISGLTDYARNISDEAFKVMKKALPGPYTFIFQASKLVPKLVLTKQKTVGIRIPDNNVALDLVREMGRPLLSTTVHNTNGDFVVNPQELEKLYRNEVDIVLDCGEKVSEISTVVDFSNGRAKILRSGKGEIFFNADFMD